MIASLNPVGICYKRINAEFLSIYMHEAFKINGQFILTKKCFSVKIHVLNLKNVVKIYVDGSKIIVSESQSAKPLNR